jgi:hypothetical protein
MLGAPGSVMPVLVRAVAPVPMPVVVVDAPPGAAVTVFGVPTGGTVPVPGVVPIPIPAPCAKATAGVPIRVIAISADKYGRCRMTELRFECHSDNGLRTLSFRRHTASRDHIGVLSLASLPLLNRVPGGNIDETTLPGRV